MRAPGNGTRREFLQAAGLGAGAALLAQCAPGGAGRQRPNLVLLLTDDQRGDAMHCAGNDVIQTPHMDRLASDGMRFRNAFVTTSICPVSRVSILTGQYMRRHEVLDFVASPSAATMEDAYPSLLRRAGYYTGFVGKWGIGTNQAAADRAADGFDYWAGAAEQGNYWHEATCPYITHDGVHAKHQNVCTCPPSGPKQRTGHANLRDPKHLTVDITPAKCAQFLDSRAADKPFCLSVSFKAPHAPRSDFHPSFADLYTEDELPVPPTATPDDAARQPRFLRESPSGTGGARLAEQHDVVRERLRRYYRLISGVDRAVGHIRQLLSERGLAENTIIILTSDNGYLFGEHGLTSKWLMHEASIRVPLLVFDPRLPADAHGRTCDEMALNIDLAPTLLELAGVAPPPRMQGSSLVHLLDDPNRPHRDDWFYEYHFRTERYPIERTEGVRTRRWKYVRYLDQQPRFEQLFDLADDPLERWNLAALPEHAEVLTRLRARWRHYRQSLG